MVTRQEQVKNIMAATPGSDAESIDGVDRFFGV